MSDCVIVGTITAEVAPSGPVASTYIGSPLTYATSSTLTVEYEEESRGVLKIDSTDGIVTISLNAVASGTVVYLGADKQVEFTINGNAFTIGDGTGASTDGGFTLFVGSAITTITVEAQLAVDTTVVFAAYGE